jgi:hypothetical protein
MLFYFVIGYFLPMSTFQNLGANIRRVFALPNGFRKIFRIVFSTFAAIKKRGLMGRKFLFFTFVLISFTSVGLAQEKLQYHLKKGDIFRIKQVAKQDIIQDIDGASHEITNDLSGILEFKVKGKSEDIYTVDVTFRELLMRMTSSIQGVILDVNARDLDPDNIQSRIFYSLLDQPIHLKMRNNGDILEVRGGDSLVARMVKASDLQDAFALNMLKSSLRNEFGSEALSNSYKQMTFIYPNRGISQGESWTNSYSGKLKAENSWTLDSLNTMQARISGVSDIVMDIKEPATTMQLEGTQKTRITTDKKTGFILNMLVEGVSKGFSTIAQMGDQKIPTTITSKVTYELIQ